VVEYTRGGDWQRASTDIARKNQPAKKKKPQGVSRYGALDSIKVGINKTNVFLIPPAYKKTPHACKGLHGRFGRGFFEGS
jgi:hypothetical protein